MRLKKSLCCLLTTSAFLSIGLLFAESEQSYTEKNTTYYQAGLLSTLDLADFDKLSRKRKKIIEQALEIRAKNGWLKYKFGSADPTKGGFDCSGSMYYLFTQAGYKIPRTSAQQYLWIKKAGKLYIAKEKPSSMEEDLFKNIRPGDLLFWGGTYEPTDGRTVDVTHVSMFLGKNKDGKPVMIGSSKGRYYKGKARDGFGVFEFKLPRKTSKTHFVGFGTPPPLLEEEASKASCRELSNLN